MLHNDLVGKTMKPCDDSYALLWWVYLAIVLSGWAFGLFLGWWAF